MDCVSVASEYIYSTIYKWVEYSYHHHHHHYHHSWTIFLWQWKIPKWVVVVGLYFPFYSSLYMRLKHTWMYVEDEWMKKKKSRRKKAIIIRSERRKTDNNTHTQPLLLRATLYAAAASVSACHTHQTHQTHQTPLRDSVILVREFVITVCCTTQLHTHTQTDRQSSELSLSRSAVQF